MNTNASRLTPLCTLCVALALTSGWASAQQAYRLTDVGTLGGTESFGIAINNAGQATGYSFTTGDLVYHAFLWDGSVLEDLGTLGGTHSGGAAINDAGQVTGDSGMTGDLANHAFLWDGSTMRDLGTLGGSSSIGYAINDAGQVTGDSIPASNVGHPRFLVGRHHHAGPRHAGWYPRSRCGHQ